MNNGTTMAKQYLLQACGCNLVGWWAGGGVGAEAGTLARALTHRHITLTKHWLQFLKHGLRFLQQRQAQAAQSVPKAVTPAVAASSTTAAGSGSASSPAAASTGGAASLTRRAPESPRSDSKEPPEKPAIPPEEHPAFSEGRPPLCAAAALSCHCRSLHLRWRKGSEDGGATGPLRPSCLPRSSTR